MTHPESLQAASCKQHSIKPVSHRKRATGSARPLRARGLLLGPPGPAVPLSLSSIFDGAALETFDSRIFATWPYSPRLSSFLHSYFIHQVVLAIKLFHKCIGIQCTTLFPCVGDPRPFTSIARYFGSAPPTFASSELAYTTTLVPFYLQTSHGRHQQVTVGE